MDKVNIKSPCRRVEKRNRSFTKDTLVKFVSLFKYNPKKLNKQTDEQKANGQQNNYGIGKIATEFEKP